MAMSGIGENECETRRSFKKCGLEPKRHGILANEKELRQHNLPSTGSKHVLNMNIFVF